MDNMEEPKLCCLKCGSLNISPSIPNVETHKMKVLCNNCGNLFEVDVRIDGVEDNKLKVTYIPQLII